MKGHVKNKLQLRRLAKDSFMDSLPLLRRELPLVSQVPSSLSLRAAAVVLFGSPENFRFSPAAGLAF
jgi:hypothetical protein